jgi:hypothetical protein
MTEDLESRVREAFAARAATVGDPREPDWTASAVRRTVRARFVPLAASAAVLLVVAAAVFADARMGGLREPASPPIDARPATSCVADVPSQVIPEWARAGFTAPEPRMPYVLGARGDIVAILFGNPLAAPPRRDLANKILWVSRVPITQFDTLVIDARLDDSTTTVRRTVLGGPGPSIIDLPRSGCWRLTLKWSQHVDMMDLRYSPQNG